MRKGDALLAKRSTNQLVELVVVLWVRPFFATTAVNCPRLPGNIRRRWTGWLIANRQHTSAPRQRDANFNHDVRIQVACVEHCHVCADNVSGDGVEDMGAVAGLQRAELERNATDPSFRQHPDEGGIEHLAHVLP